MIAARPDLLIVGGLTVDHLADGSIAPGGSVLHAARAVAAAGWRVSTVTAAGSEAAARAGLGELAATGPMRARRVRHSISFAIEEADGWRRLVTESVGSAVSATDVRATADDAAAVLLAPVAGEISAAVLLASAAAPVRVAALQGWLRELSPGQQVQPRPLSALGATLSGALAAMDLLVASDEDLAAIGADPDHRLDALRAQFGPRPLLVVTTGERGVLLDDPADGRRHLAAGERVEGVSTIGAGDALAGLLAAGLGARMRPLAALTAAQAGTVTYLRSRP
jgi:sugar/nucleoside kinase (ribokinase family)